MMSTTYMLLIASKGTLLYIFPGKCSDASIMYSQVFCMQSLTIWSRGRQDKLFKTSTSSWACQRRQDCYSKPCSHDSAAADARPCFCALVAFVTAKRLPHQSCLA